MLIVLCGVSNELGSKIMDSLVRRDAKPLLVNSNEMPASLGLKLANSIQSVCIAETSTAIKILLVQSGINEHTKEIYPFSIDFYKDFFEPLMSKKMMVSEEVLFVNIAPLKLNKILKFLSRCQNTSPLNSNFQSAFGCPAVTLYLPKLSVYCSSNKLGNVDGEDGFFFGLLSRVLRMGVPAFSMGILIDWLFRELPTSRLSKLLTLPQKDNPCYSFTKRLIDFFLALIGLLVLFLPMCFIWLLIKSEGGGPAIFAQKRLGQHERIFTCFKFRTMPAGTPDVATHKVLMTSISSLGLGLRRFKLDELPQLWNVLVGQMSLIGPRPCLPNQSELVRLRRENGVFEVLPGISGLSQIFGVDMSDPRKLVKWDNCYIKLQCLSFDILLIFRTVFGSGRGDSLQKSGKKSETINRSQ